MKVLSLEPAQVAAIEAHARACLPAECCGILVGRRLSRNLAPDGSNPGDVLSVTELHPVPNVAPADQRSHYEIDPLAHLRLQRTVRERGLHILGFYHSHPQGPARPSATDVRQAWSGYAYLIVGHGLRAADRSTAGGTTEAQRGLHPQPERNLTQRRRDRRKTQQCLSLRSLRLCVSHFFLRKARNPRLALQRAGRKDTNAICVPPLSSRLHGPCDLRCWEWEEPRDGIRESAAAFREIPVRVVDPMG